MSDADRQFSPAAERNRDPILAVLRRVLPASGRVLEVAAGTGQHAAWFAAHLPGLTWCPTEPDAAGRASVAAWCEGLANVEAPVALDVTGPWDVGPVDAIYCANMVHISPWAATLGLVAGAADRMLELPKSFYLLGLKRKDSASHLHRLREARLSYSDMNQVRVNKHTDKYRENQCLVS